VDPSPLTVAVAAVVALAGVALAAAALRGLSASRRERARGELVAIDAGASVTLRAPRYRLAGRPDVLRRLPDGRIVPIELKSRPAPAGGPPPSHRVQLEAYCLLVEETTGVAPPYGLLRYGDGQEFRLAWTPAARAELLGVRASVDRPYDGRATPTAAKCARCGWRPVCDVRAPGT